ncbi:MAG: ABC transporter ATP-binding protein [Clostridia bacterium]|nr:ABC transporter ATP-binding protein [Clostridia bacterium]
MGTILEAKGVSKSFGGIKALNALDLKLERGRIMGLLGPNGSGKTTFLKVIAGLLRPDSGEISIDQNPVGLKTKSLVSYLPDRNTLYPWMKVQDAIEFYSDLFEDFDEDKARELLELMKIKEVAPVKSLSKGMQEKLNLCLVFARRARLYVLDEPLGGTDPVAREKIIDLIITNFREDSSILLTTHLVGNIERLFDDAAFICKGEIVLQGNAEELRLDRGRSIDEIYREVFKDE